MGRLTTPLPPGYWNEYRPPRTHVAAAIEYPLDDRWMNRVLNGLLKDTLERRTALGASGE
jgi:hypothetical protein